MSSPINRKAEGCLVFGVGSSNGLWEEHERSPFLGFDEGIKFCWPSRMGRGRSFGSGEGPLKAKSTGRKRNVRVGECGEVLLT